MLTVETIGRIRREFFVQGKTIKEIARELRVSRNTVRKVVRSGRTDAEYARQIQPRPKLGRWTAELEAVLAAQCAGDCDGYAEPVKSCVPFSARPTWFGGRDRSEASLDEFFTWLGPKKCGRIQLAVMDSFGVEVPYPT